MKYDNNSTIKTMCDVRAFFDHLTNERNLVWHPEDSFKTYVDGDTFHLDECLLYDRLMDECFRTCRRNGKDIYDVAMETQVKKMKALEVNCKKIAEKRVLKRGMWIDAEKYKPTDVDGYEIGDFVAYIICYGGDKFKFDVVTGWYDNYNGNFIPERFPVYGHYTINKFCVLPKITREVLGEEE